MITISILIPIHNRLAVTKQGLSYIKEALDLYYLGRNTLCDFQVVVIDDGSTDGSSEWIKENHPEIHILKGDGNLWWSGAVNMGAKYSINELHAGYLLLWNDDVIPGENYFAHLEKWMTDNRMDNTIVGSKIVVHNNSHTIWSVGGFFNPFSGKAGMYNQEVAANGNFLKCDWQPGMGTLIPTSIITKFNLWWDEKKFPQYHGDSDFVLRCKRKGVKVVTDLNLILYNRTELTGITKKKSIKDLYNGLTSVRSNYNFHKYFLFYTQHGVIPFVYYGMFKKYFFYIGGYIKHSILK